MGNLFMIGFEFCLVILRLQCNVFLWRCSVQIAGLCIAILRNQNECSNKSFNTGAYNVNYLNNKLRIVLIRNIIYEICDSIISIVLGDPLLSLHTKKVV